MSQTFDVEGVNLPKTNLGLAKMNKLVDVAEQQFVEKSYFGTSVADICKAAHTAIGTFYIYFDSKTAAYRYLVERYKHQIRRYLATKVAYCHTRYEKEREGLRAFVSFSVRNPQAYNIIWGSLAVDKQMFVDYYVSFAKNYAKSLMADGEELAAKDYTSMAYMLMGINNFIGLRAIFEEMTDEQIDEIVNNVMKMLDSMFADKAN